MTGSNYGIPRVGEPDCHHSCNFVWIEWAEKLFIDYAKVGAESELISGSLDKGKCYWETYSLPFAPKGTFAAFDKDILFLSFLIIGMELSSSRSYKEALSFSKITLRRDLAFFRALVAVSSSFLLLLPPWPICHVLSFPCCKLFEQLGFHPLIPTSVNSGRIAKFSLFRDSFTCCLTPLLMNST